MFSQVETNGDGIVFISQFYLVQWILFYTTVSFLEHQGRIQILRRRVDQPSAEEGRR